MATQKKTTAKPKISPVSSKQKTITNDDIRKRAEKIYNERISKGIPGSSESDWLQAEEELRGSK